MNWEYIKSTLCILTVFVEKQVISNTFIVSSMSLCYEGKGTVALNNCSRHASTYAAVHFICELEVQIIVCIVHLDNRVCRESFRNLIAKWLCYNI